MKIFVTGGAGFIGSHIVDALVSLGHTVFVIDNLASGKKENVNPRSELLELDVTDEKGIGKIFGKIQPDAVFHLAAQIDVRQSVSNPRLDAEINILGSLNIISSAHERGCKKFIFTSSGGALYGDTENIPTPESHPARPVSPYGVTKLSIEEYLYYFYVVWRLPYIALRYANVYGPRQNSRGEAGVVAIFCDSMLRGVAPTIYGDGAQTRDYVYVADIVEANIAALTSTYIGPLNIGTGKETDVNTLALMLREATGFSGDFSRGPAKFGEQKRSSLDSSLAKEVLGWVPKTELKDGIQKTVEWFRRKNFQKNLV